MNKKYELLTNDSIRYNNATLYRIKALKDFTDVKKGDLGGYIEKEDNLSQDGNAWVAGNAKVFGNAKVSGDATVYGNAKVFGDATVYGSAMVCSNARVFDNATVYDNAKVFGDVTVHGSAMICGNACVYGNAWLYGDAKVYNNNADYVVIQGFASEDGSNTTFFKCKDNTIKVKCGCFRGTIDEFENKVKETHGDNKYAKEYLAIITAMKIHFEI